jgi:hypothetical protein
MALGSDRKETLMKRLVLAAAFVSLALASAANADDDHVRCGNVPIADWMSEADLRSKVTGMGIDVRDIEIDDGCYEVEGRNSDGRKLEIRFHPQTAEQISVDGDD